MKGNTPAWQNRMGVNKKGKRLYSFGQDLIQKLSYEYPDDMKMIESQTAKVHKATHFNWREDFVWQDEVEEAIKRPKLDIQEKGVKNKIEVNPDDGLKEEKKKLRLPEARTRKLIPDVKVIKKSVKDMSKPVGTTGGVDYRLMAQSYEPEGEAIDEKRN
jgi:hypothetical protein